MRGFNFRVSDAMQEKAVWSIPNGTGTFSKSQTALIKGKQPFFAEHGKGCWLYDVDGNRYVDYSMGLTAVLLGYRFPQVDREVVKQIEASGAIFSLPHRLESDVAERIIDMVPCAEMVRFGKNGSDATAGAVRLARYVTGRDAVLCCYDKETEVLSRSGFKKFEDLVEGEEVATLNPLTQELEYQIPTKHIKYRFTGDLVTFTGQKLDLAVTPDHNIYRRFQNRAGEYSYRLSPAEKEIKRKTFVTMTSACVWRGGAREKVIIPGVPGGQSRPTKGITEFGVLDFAAFMGWWLSEGSLIIDGKGRHDIVISQDGTKNPEKMQEIKKVVERLGFAPYVNGHHIRFSSKELVLYLQPFGGCASKRIPQWIKDAEKPVLDVFIDAMIKGDGTFEKGKMRRFYSSNRLLASDMQEVLIKAGHSTLLSSRKNNGYSPNNEIYTVFISSEREFGGRVGVMPYDDFVYCVTVPNHIILVRRNGRPVWSGNCGYHGWQDWYIGTTGRNGGVPGAVAELTHQFKYNDLESFTALMDEHAGRVACVIMEPMNRVYPEPGFLEAIQARCQKDGAIFILDEVITGFRFAKGGAQEILNIKPDLCTLGKGIANGYALSAVAGRRDLMEGFSKVHFSFTYSGDCIGLAAAKATLDFIDDRFTFVHREIRSEGNVILRALEKELKDETLKRMVQVNKGHPSWIHLDFENPTIKAFFIGRMAEYGVFTIGTFNLSYSHGDPNASATVLEAIRRVFADMLLIEQRGNWKKFAREYGVAGEGLR